MGQTQRRGHGLPDRGQSGHGRASAFFLQYSGADQRWAFSFVNLRALSPTKPVAGQWYHLVGVRDAEEGTISLYVDGEKVATQYACYEAASTGHTVVARGEFGGNKVDYLNGAVDDVWLFDPCAVAGRGRTAHRGTPQLTPAPSPAYWARHEIPPLATVRNGWPLASRDVRGHPR